MDAGTRKNPSIYPVDYHSQSPLHRGKLALFDIDDTLYDCSQREQNAVRAGLVVYGDRAPGELRKSTKPKGRKAFLDFFNSPEQFRTDTPFPGAVEYVRSLVNKGYTIAYLSGRDAKPMEATIEHLKETGFPIFKNNRGETMVYLKKNRKTPTDRYKYEKMRELQAEYDIHYFFDDLQKNRDKALSLGVIGVYHLPAHLGIKQNPARMNVPTEVQPPDSSGVSLATLIRKYTTLHPQAKYPLKKQYYQTVLKSNKPLPGEFIILGGGALRELDIDTELELRSLGWKIAGRTPGEWLGDLNVGRIERMSMMGGSDERKGRGLYVHRKMFGPGFKPTPTNPAHPIYDKAGIAAVQFRPGLVMTNYSRVLMKRGSGPFEVMAGNITVPDPETGVVGVPRTKFATRAESFFYGRRNAGAGMRIETRISDYEYPDFNTHFYWPMRLPEMYLDTTAPPTPLLEDDADGGMILTQEDYQQRVIDSLPPGWQQPAKERMGALGPYQRPGDSWTRLNPNTEVPAGYREAAGCMVQRASDGKILFLRRSPKETSKHGLYEFPGGKLEDGETAREAALIETEEEAGLKVKIVRQLDSHVDHSMKKVYHCFLAVPKKGARVKLSEEHDKFMWAGPNKKWPKSKLSHHARYMINQLHDSDSEYHKYIDKVHEILTIEGGAAGLSALKPAFPKKTSKKKAESLLAKMPGVVQHADGDYILVTGLSNPALPNPLPKPKKKNGRKEPSKNYVKRMMGNTKMRAEFPDAGQRYAVTLKLVEKHYGKATRKRIAPRDNGLFGPKKHDYQFRDSFGGMVSRGKKGRANVHGMKAGTNVQATEYGLIIEYPYGSQPDWVEFSSKSANYATERRPGPVSMVNFSNGQFDYTKPRPAGERMVQKALDRLPPREKRVNEFNQDVAFTAPTFDEIMDSIPDVDDIPQEEMNEMFARYGIKPTRSNPRKPLDGMEDKKIAKAKRAYKKFHGGKEPTDMKKETIDVGDVWYALGPCWSIGYMSPKETGEDDQKYIHHTNEDSKDGNFPMMYATMPENGEPMIVIKGGSMKIGMRDGLAWLID